MRQFFLFVRKEFLHVFRDWKTLLVLMGLPLVQIALFGFALTNEVKGSKIVVIDYAHDAASARLIDRIAANAYFDIERSMLSADGIDRAFKEGRVKLAVVIPDRFGEELLRVNTGRIQVIADASDPNTATTLTNYVSAIVRDEQAELQRTAKLPYRIVTESRMLYNPELRGAPNYVPGVMALILMLVCVMMTAISIVREKELGTMEILLVSPFRPLFVVLAKAVPYLLLSVANIVSIILLSTYILEVPVVGSIAFLMAESTLFILTCLSLGLLISVGAKTQQEAMGTSLMGMMLPTMLLSGFMFPIENMPVPMQVISYAVPSRWFYTIVKGIMLKGLGIDGLWKETLILVAMMLFFLAITLKKFKIRLA